MAVVMQIKRSYQETRSKDIEQKLPMAMIHESCGTVISDPTGTYEVEFER